MNEVVAISLNIEYELQPTFDLESLSFTFLSSSPIQIGDSIKIYLPTIKSSTTGLIQLNN